jgi:hypothetical protein
VKCLLLRALLPVGLLLLLPAESSLAHGWTANSRILQVRLAGLAGGTPAAWNASYYT